MTIVLDSITLPDDLIWSNEYDWHPVSQVINKSLTGALIIQEAAQIKGREITLTGGADYAWITKATLDLLKVKVDTPDLTMVLAMNGTNYNVIFNRSGNSGAIQAATIKGCANPSLTENYSVILNLITV
jgi:hypothetical protein